jgi:hypothetical protein
MTEKSARETLREAVSEFAAKCLRPEGLPDALLLLERELELPSGQAHAEVLSAFYARKLRGWPGAELPANERALCRSVLLALGHQAEELDVPTLNPRHRDAEAWAREIRMSLLEGTFDELVAREQAEREALQRDAAQARARARR